MSKLESLLHDPTTGLLPYLEAVTTENFDRFQIRQYSFGSAAQRTGYRVRNIRTQYSGLVAERVADFTIGKLIDVTDPAIDYQIVAANYAVLLQDSIHEWSRCKAPGLKSVVVDLDTPIALSDNPGITGKSTNPAAWAIVVTVSGQIEYFE